MSVLSRVEWLIFNPDRRTATLATAGLLLAGASVAALLIAVAGPMYGLVGFLAVVAALLMLTGMRWGYMALFAIVGILPFATFPFKIGFTPSFIDAGLLALYFVWVMRVATRRQPRLVGTPIGGLVFLFALLAVFAFANGLRYGTPTSTTVRNFAELLLGILFFFLLTSSILKEDDLHLLVRLIILAGTAAALIAIILYVLPQNTTIRILDALGRLNYPGGAGALRYIEDDPANPMRAIGLHVDPNVLGGFLILMAGLTAPQLVSSRPLFRRSVVAFALVVQLLALYLTYSRGSLLGLAIGLLLIGLLRYRKLLLVAVLGAALLLLLPQAQAYVAHMMEGLQVQDRATLMRLGEYKDALALIARYPWFGVGFTGSPDADLYVGVSNLYLLMAEEMGAVGVFVFLLVIAGFFVSMWRAWRRTVDPRREAILLGLMAAVLGVVAGGMLDHYLFNLVYPHMTILLWTYLALGMAACSLPSAS